ncbi:cyclin-H-like isoform X1 [Biomphalaria glabrata]|uniref:Cyclin-H n=1 Tax=Biomphalaria glabrata TaxID=6526 RepID=A0A2C9KSQ6_BIOGL|nr:cyclin-H-like isoform X1 [Biomphalaria glabrata]XP_055882683.1 cyclin-H-like isoform X1 [Biomphalaria glabrata]KAI8735661.1 cyclin-H-like isoform X1 [Biomphalaria glabrata]
MFSISTQAKYWLFTGETELATCRAEANRSYISSRRAHLTDNEVASCFLTPMEEKLLSRQYEVVLRKFCSEFQPPMPKCVIGTSLAYFKRFYVHNSNMDYHPKDIMLTCVYLACKVEEFYVPIGQFVKNLRGDREKFADAILSFELTLMSKLNYHLTVHNPFRPMEGFIIDIKTRYKDIQNIEIVRRTAEEFMERSLQSDACLIFSPAQIALAALSFGATKEGLSLDRYIKEILFKTATEKEAEDTLYQLRRVKFIVKNTESVPREQAQAIQKKLDQCRNQENNPDSDVYKQRMLEKLDEEEDVRHRKRAKLVADDEPMFFSLEQDR